MSMRNWLSVKKRTHLNTRQLYLEGRIFKMIGLQGIGFIHIKHRMIRLCVWWG